MVKETTRKPVIKGKGAGAWARDVSLILGGVGLIAAGVDNVAITVAHVQLIAPGAFAVRVVFVLAGIAIGLRGFEGLWGVEIRDAWNRGRYWTRTRWRAWREAAPPQLVAGTLPGVPPARNPLFRHREAELAELRRRLSIERRVGLSGLGGVGKSQLAREYLHRHHSQEQDDYPAGAFWVRGETVATLAGDLAALAWLPELQLAERHLRDQELVVDAVVGWLRAHERWLVVVDNLDESVSSTLDRRLSRSLRGHLLVTSRVPIWEPEALAVRPMPQEDAIAFLLERSGQPDSRPAAARVAEILGGLPLALVQAAAYVRSTGRDLSSYADLLQERMAELLQHGRPADYPLTVAATWALSFQRIGGDLPAAASLLSLCAFLGPDGIPLRTLSEGAAKLPKKLRVYASNPVRLDACIAELLRYAMAERQGEELRVHRLVQAAMRTSLGEGERKRWLSAAIRLMNSAFPELVEDPATWSVCTRLVPHGQIALELMGDELLEPLASSLLLARIAGYLQIRGEYRAAWPMCERALAITERVLGPDHPNTAASLNNLAGLLLDQGELAAARPLLERALAIRERALGPDHPNTATGLNNLARLLHDQGELAAARPLFERALAIRERALGPDHPVTAISLNNLARLLRDQGDLAAARPLFERTLAIWERVLGPDHPDTAISLNNLAGLLYDQGEPAAARPLFERALAIRERALGLDHPNTATTLNNLASLLLDQGEPAAARPLFECALATRERVLGPDHPDTAISLNNLASLLHDQGEPAAARPLFERALSILERVLGPDHPNTTSVKDRLNQIDV